MSISEDRRREMLRLGEAMNEAARRIERAITPLDRPEGTDAAGGTVACLTEAVMGVTAGLCKIADAINNLAEAVREKGMPKCPTI